MNKTAKGPPAPPVTLAAAPTAASENKTKFGTCIAKPIPTAIAAPTTCASVAKFPASTKNLKKTFSFSLINCCPRVLIIVPNKSDANNP